MVERGRERVKGGKGGVVKKERSLKEGERARKREDREGKGEKEREVGRKRGKGIERV